MSNLISGKEAFIALANGEEVEFKNLNRESWHAIESFSNYRLDEFLEDKLKFRLKPKTITLNGIEVPAPFEPKYGEIYFHLWAGYDLGYGHNRYDSVDDDGCFTQFGAWRTEEEIKQVVEALRKVFNP